MPPVVDPNDRQLVQNLLSAVASGEPVKVAECLKSGVNINCKSPPAPYGYMTPLTTAVEKEKIDIVTLLLDQGADINANRGDSGSSGMPLSLAAALGNRAMIELLLAREADINASSGKNTETALSASARNDREDIVNLLVDRGADINAVGGKYGTALGGAAFHGNFSLTKWLLDRGANVNIVGCGTFATALAAAAFNHNVDVMNLLLDQGAELNIVGGQYGTALGAAAYKGYDDVVRMLLGRGAKVNGVVGGQHGTPLITAMCLYPDSGNKERYMNCVKMMLEEGADVHAIGGSKHNALTIAAFWRKLDYVRMLLDYGADINRRAGPYGTALAGACYKVSGLSNHDVLGVARTLITRGADVNALLDSDDGSALATAVHTTKGSPRNKETVEFLLKKGADINLVNGKYGTALATAAYHGEHEIVKLLLERGADPNAPGGEYGTALGCAAYQGKMEIVSLLLDQGADAWHVGGCYASTHGMYPNVMDAYKAASNSSESSASSPSSDSAMLELLEDALRKTRPSLGENELLSRPPFPMPYVIDVSAYLVSRPAAAFSDSHEGAGHHHDVHLFPATPSAMLDLQGNITPEQAKVLCNQLDKDHLLSLLVALVGLDEETTERLQHWINGDVIYFMACNFDFGLAYSAARLAWKDFNEQKTSSSRFISFQRARWHKQAKRLDEERSNAIKVDHTEQALIEKPYSIMPRRIWDIKSNRVIEFRTLHAYHNSTASIGAKSGPTFWAVSHSWTDAMHSVDTAVNLHQWGVPLPPKVNIETNLRSELLSFGASYVWLDVLCLRQDGSLQQEEWSLDVPTIGNIYRAAERIVRYFNGLGKPFSPHGWGDPRHWFSRAWTLQEIKTEHTTINGGVSKDGVHGPIFMNAQSTISKLENEVETTVKVTLRSMMRPIVRLAAKVDSPQGCEVYELAREMAKRYASNPVDKISGLFYLLNTIQLPCYDKKMEYEKFWKLSCHLLPFERKLDILLDFPFPGSDGHWIPTWQQMMDWPERNPDYEYSRADYTQLKGEDYDSSVEDSKSLLVRNIWSLGPVFLETTTTPCEYIVEIGGKAFGFYSPYLSHKAIVTRFENQRIEFIFVVVSFGHEYNWVVCETFEESRREEKQVMYVLRKVGILKTDACGDILVGAKNGGSMLERVDCLFV